MTAHTMFDPYAELRRIRSSEADPSQVSQTLAARACEPDMLPDNENLRDSSSFSSFSSFSSRPPQTDNLPPGIDWREWYEERVAVATIDGKQPDAEARRIAWECCIVRWLDLHPVRSEPDRCAWCGKTDSPGNIVPFGTEPTGHAWLHPQCWKPWQVHRRTEAVAALATSGITIGDNR